MSALSAVLQVLVCILYSVHRGWYKASACCMLVFLVDPCFTYPFEFIAAVFAYSVLPFYFLTVCCIVAAAEFSFFF
ncbi:hypothetical protein, partial [Tenacibaculum discolor]|uniref:hypothetical protein n=1 Tax=Tenacibaculum discolor TaxID=361581 RepID=UPI001145E16E